MMKYYISIGSNINAQSNIDLALDKLQQVLSSTNRSSTYKTKAEGFKGNDFLNLVVVGNTDLSFNDLNSTLKTIEDESGRDRNVSKFSNRTLDLDIVLQINDRGEEIFKSDEINQYDFVSRPLNELLGDQ